MIISKQNCIVLWHFLVLIVAGMKCSCLSVLVVYGTERTAKCAALAILIHRYQLVNDIRARRSNACIHICSITQQSSRTELHFTHWVPYSFSWIASPATRDCLSWHWISWHLLLLKPMMNDYSRCVVIWQQENGTVLRFPFVGGYFWNWTVTFCTELNGLWTEV